MGIKKCKIQSRGTDSSTVKQPYPYIRDTEIQRETRPSYNWCSVFKANSHWRFGEKLEPVRDDCATDITTTNDEEVLEDSKKMENKGEWNQKPLANHLKRGG